VSALEPQGDSRHVPEKFPMLLRTASLKRRVVQNLSVSSAAHNGSKSLFGDVCSTIYVHRRIEPAEHGVVVRVCENTTSARCRNVFLEPCVEKGSTTTLYLERPMGHLKYGKIRKVGDHSE